MRWDACVWFKSWNRIGSSFWEPICEYRRGVAPATRSEEADMPPPTDANGSLERFRAYLETLRSIQLDPRMRGRFGLSDVIQGTLLEAYRSLDQVTALDEAGQRRWLRQALLNNLRDMIKGAHAKIRDVDRERSLDVALDASSCRVNEWLAAEDSLPSERLIQQEECERLLAALAQLPEQQREVIVLKRCHGRTLDEIAVLLECTPGVVAGLHARGLAKLRKLLPEMNNP
jgi:RNA polymerase sigma-70 factor (ECF subfamily)